MKIPEEFELLSLFGVEPAFTDEIAQVSYFYNNATYSFNNNLNQSFSVLISPAYDEVKILVDENNERTSSLSFRKVISLTILSDNENESRIMITKNTGSIKINFRPRFKIYINEEIEQ